LPEEERERLEESFFADDELHGELQATVDDLIHAYLAGALSPDDRARFETHFLATPRRRERLEFVRDLVAATDRVSAQRTGARARTGPAQWYPWTLAASLLLAVSAAVFLVRPTRRDVERAAFSPAPVTPTTAPAGRAVASPTPRRAEDAVRFVRVSPARSDEPVEVALTEVTRQVRLEVAVGEDGPPAYDAALQTADGREVWRTDGVVPEGSGGWLMLSVPARLLAAGAYTLSVQGEVLRGDEDASLESLRFKLRIARVP
jgi:hypothetical protein